MRLTGLTLQRLSQYALLAIFEGIWKYKDNIFIKKIYIVYIVLLLLEDTLVSVNCRRTVI